MTEQIPTFQDSRDRHDRDYLTKVLQATGGERQRAAEIAGLNRTHLQSLINRYKIEIPFDPKTRGRRKTKRSEGENETAETQAARERVQF